MFNSVEGAHAFAFNGSSHWRGERTPAWQKTVERNEKQHAKQANYKHMVRILPGSIVTAEALQLAAREQWVGFRLGDVPGLSQSFCRHEGYFGV